MAKLKLKPACFQLLFVVCCVLASTEALKVSQRRQGCDDSCVWIFCSELTSLCFKASGCVCVRETFFVSVCKRAPTGVCGFAVIHVGLCVSVCVYVKRSGYFVPPQMCQCGV